MNSTYLTIALDNISYAGDVSGGKRHRCPRDQYFRKGIESITDSSDPLSSFDHTLSITLHHPPTRLDFERI